MQSSGLASFGEQQSSVVCLRQTTTRATQNMASLALSGGRCAFLAGGVSGGVAKFRSSSSRENTACAVSPRLLPSVIISAAHGAESCKSVVAAARSKRVDGGCITRASVSTTLRGGRRGAKTLSALGWSGPLISATDSWGMWAAILCASSFGLWCDAHHSTTSLSRYHTKYSSIAPQPTPKRLLHLYVGFGFSPAERTCFRNVLCSDGPTNRDCGC